MVVGICYVRTQIDDYRFRTQTFNYNDKGKQLKLFFFSLISK